jgi:ankyrin repeat protein
MFIYLLIIDTVRELLTHVPVSVKSETPTNPIYAVAKALSTESELTPLHLAAYSGSENVVRALLNSAGVDVEGGCSPSVTTNYQFLKVVGVLGHDI